MKIKIVDNIEEAVKGVHSKFLTIPFYERIYFYSSGLYKKFDRDHIWILASAVAFNLIICIVPFLLILLTVLGIYLDESNTINRISAYLTSVLPLQEDFKDKVITNLIDRTKELSSNTFITGAIGIFGLLWTASGLFSSMRDVINKIYDVFDETNYFIGKLKDFFLVFITLVLFLLSIAATSVYQLIQYFSESLFGTEISLTFMQEFLSMIFSLIITFAMFYVLYKYIPTIKIPWKAVFISSLFSSILFEILKYIFTLYILKFSNFGKVYGTYAAFAASLFWLYYISVIFVLGAEIGHLYVVRNKLHFLISKK